MNYHVHGCDKVCDGPCGFSLPDWDCAFAADKHLSCIVVVDAGEGAPFMEEQSLPENAVVDDEHAGVDVHMVHVNKIGHDVDEFTVHQCRKQLAFDVGKIVYHC